MLFLGLQSEFLNGIVEYKGGLLWKDSGLTASLIIFLCLSCTSYLNWEINFLSSSSVFGMKFLLVDAVECEVRILLCD